LLASSRARLLDVHRDSPGRIIVVLNEGASPPPRSTDCSPRPVDEARLLSGAGRVEALLLPRVELLEAGGLDEDLAAEVSGASPLLADLALRLLTRGRRVEHAESSGAAGMAAGEAGYSTGALLRAQRRRAAPESAHTARVLARITARTVGDLVLKRAGASTRRDLTGHDLTGLLAGFRRGTPRPRPPTINALPSELEATLADHRVVDVRAGADGANRGRHEVFTLHDADGQARLALRLRHDPPSGLRARLEAREEYRRASSGGRDWVPTLHACAELPDTLVTVESLHQGAWLTDPLLAHVEAERWLGERTSSEAPADGGSERPLEVLADELDGWHGRTPALDRAVERLGALPTVPQHGSLSAAAVAVGPGRSVLLGWEHWTEAGLPGFDAIHLALTSARRRFGAVGPRFLVGQLIAGSREPLLEPFRRDIERLGAAEHREAIVLATLALLARRERHAEARLEGPRSRTFRDVLEVWRAHRPDG
jgi:hypothetical protein